MANKRSSKQDIEKALNAKAKELGRKPTEESIYFWLTEIGVHANTHNYDIARVWRDGFQDRRPLVRDEVPDSDIAELREALRDASSSVEQSYRRTYSIAVQKIRGEAQMRVEAADHRVAEKKAEGDFLLDSWRATEKELDESRERVAVCEKELEDARLETARLQGRLDASTGLIAKLTGPATRGGAVLADADSGAKVADGPDAPIDDDAEPEQRVGEATIAQAPVRPDPAELARQLIYSPPGDDDGDGVSDVDAGVPDAASTAVMSAGNSGKDQPAAIVTPPALEGQIAMPIVNDSTADQAAGGDGDRG